MMNTNSSLSLSCYAQPYALVVDDNPAFSRILIDLLEMKGCRAIVVENTLSALKLVAQLTPKVIFCNVGLSGKLNGLFFAKAVKNNAELSKIPLVAISGSENDVDKDETLQSGFDMIFSKPLKFADFTKALKVFLNR